MPPFPQPDFEYDYDPGVEICALRALRLVRKIPRRTRNTLLFATWNIANFGLHHRNARDRELIAEILTWFDMTAIQEVNDNFSDLVDVQQRLGKNYRLLFSDVAGNRERMAFIYNSRKVKQLEKVGEIAIPPSDLRHIKLPGVEFVFTAFDRNPYIGTFEVGGTSFSFVNVHLFFGSHSNRQDIERRTLETYAVARWAALRHRSIHAFTREIVALGDFNMPKVDRDDFIFRALTKRGLVLPEHTSRVGSNLAGDKHYDQIAFFPEPTGSRFEGVTGVFDFDNAVFAGLWQHDPRGFQTYVRYHLSDHRPMWMQLRL